MRKLAIAARSTTMPGMAPDAPAMDGATSYPFTIDAVGDGRPSILAAEQRRTR